MLWRGGRGASRLLRQVLVEARPSGSRGLHSGSGGAGQQFSRGPAAALARQPWLAVMAVGLSAGLGLTYYAGGESAQCKAAEGKQGSLPEFTREEVAKHRSKEGGGRVWVTYQDGVYDITEFVENHPGGAKRIMMAAGGAIDPFWAMYQQHNTAQVKDILAGYRIGRLKGGAGQQPVADPYVNEPKDRHPALLVRSGKPMNSETPGELLAASLITPIELFYIRNHLPVPEVDEKAYRLTIEGEGLRTMELSLDDLKRNFRKHTVAATIQCAGNRRNSLNKVKPVKGLEWELGSIGTAEWGGVRLRDVLQAAGIREEDPNIKHVQFEGLDKDLAASPYGASIPLDLALGCSGDVLLAYEMNGQPLSQDHGAPLRVVVPGVSGCRNVKWVSRIIASGEESKSFWQTNDYKGFSPNVDWDSVDWDSAPPIYKMPVTSAICEPAPGTVVDDDEVTVRGYAWSGGGAGIIRVDVSVDEGKTWHTAQLQRLPQTPGRCWAWTLWEAAIPVPKGAAGGALRIMCKATDENYNTQPESPAPIWNLRGVVCNSWHGVEVQVAK